MIQDISPYIFYNQYKPLVPGPSSIVLIFNNRSVLIKRETNNTFRFPYMKEMECWEDMKSTYLFSIDDQSFFLTDIPPTLPEGFSMEDIKAFREGNPKHIAFAGMTAFTLYNWYTNHKFCGRCATPFQQHAKERMLHCPVCGNTEYPKISPAVIVGVRDGERLLLSKYANREYSNYALLAGFAEIGETIEETISREVMEEVGVKVKNITYYKSQPWGFTDCLLLGFYCDLDGEPTITLDKEELAVAEWVNREQIPPGNAELSLTGEMIEYFRLNGDLNLNK